MSCFPQPPRFDVERTLDLPAPPDEVWSELVGGEWLGDDVEIDARPGGALRVDDRVGVVEAADARQRLAFRWTDRDGSGPASRVDVELMPLGMGTRLRVRETRLHAHASGSVAARPFLARHEPVPPGGFDARRPRALARA
jgi:uncharacterized protein YndB with AHSA1/START domain